MSDRSELPIGSARAHFNAPLPPVRARSSSSRTSRLVDKRVMAQLGRLQMSTPKSGLDIGRIRHIPACLKARIAAALRLVVRYLLLKLCLLG